MNYLSSVSCGNEKIPLQDTFIYVAVDPAATGAANATTNTDKTGWVVGAVTAQAVNIILEFNEEYFEVSDLLPLLYTLQQRWRPKAIGVEGMMFLQSYLYSAMQRNGRILPLVTLRHGGRSKAGRIKAILPFLSRTYFVRDAVDKAQASLYRWHESMKHGDDGIDALAYWFDLAVPPTLNDLIAHREQRRQWAQEDRYATMDARTRAEAKAIGKYYDTTSRPHTEFDRAFLDT